MYERLNKAIAKVRLIDGHCHVGLAMVGEDATVPADARLPYRDPFCHPRDSKTGDFKYQENLHYEAYEKIYGFTPEILDEALENRELFEELERKYHARRNDVVNLTEQVMDLAGVDYIIGNFAMPSVLMNHPKVGFIPRIDPLLYPFGNEKMAELRGSKATMRQFEWELKQLCEEMKDTYEYDLFEDYLVFVDRALDHYREKGCPGYKIFSAYTRSTLFANENPNSAQNDYELARDGDLDAYLRFQNRVVHRMAQHAADLDLPIQFHMAMVDGDIDATNPLNFQTFLQDDKTLDSKLVILHGGYPRYSETAAVALAAKPRCVNNIYIDISGRIMFSGHPKIIADMLHQWLIYPPLWKKITYGSDMIYGERVLYTCARTGRLAVYYALERLIDDGIIDEEKAIEIAKDILRNNAIRLYKLNLPIA